MPGTGGGGRRFGECLKAEPSHTEGSEAAPSHTEGSEATPSHTEGSEAAPSHTEGSEAAPACYSQTQNSPARHWRWDLYARQLDDGSYVCVHEPLNVGHLFAHLRGEITLGTYLLDQESQACFIILDADDAQAWEHLGHLARALAGDDVPTYLEKSRRGGHLWLFLAEAVTGRYARFWQGLVGCSPD